MKIRHLIVAAAAIVLCSTASSPSETVRERTQQNPAFRVYSVIFGVTLNAETNVLQFRVSKVIDPASGSTAAVDVQVPETYVTNAQKKFASKRNTPKLVDGKPVEFFTYYFYTPAYPDLVITDLDAPIGKQP
jgi:hypothetical protein